jgi:hypothetical protein
MLSPARPAGASQTEADGQVNKARRAVTSAERGAGCAGMLHAGRGEQERQRDEAFDRVLLRAMPCGRGTRSPSTVNPRERQALQQPQAVAA